MRKLLCLLLTSLLLCSALPASAAQQGPDEVIILFTHDLHSNFLPFPRADGEETHMVGGFARLKTLLDTERDGVDALLVDAGDFSMGTMFQTIFPSHASELRMLGRMGYDAVTLGNHEFDFGTQGLADMLHSAARSTDRLPALLFHAGEGVEYEANDHPVTLLEDLGDALFDAGAQQTLVVNKNGINIGLFSVFGEEATEFSPTMAIQPPGIIDNARAAVKTLQDAGAELIVCLSHSGTKENPRQSEDEQLAAAVPEIDVIISAHTHTYLFEPIIDDSTIIASCGEYGQYLGRLILRRDGDGWAMMDYTLLPVDGSIAENSTLQTDIDQFKSTVEQQYLTRFGTFTYDQVIGRLQEELPYDVYDFHGESRLGNLIADAYAAAASKEGDPVAAAVVPAGTIRWALPAGDITLANVFHTSALGMGADEQSGYPLIDCYLTGQELINAAELDASVTGMMPDAQLFFSGLHYTFNPSRIIFNRVTDAWLVDENGQRVEIEKNGQYRVALGLYSAQMLASVKSKTFGLLSLVPKDENGEEITDFYTRILVDDYGTEIKEWFAIASYIMACPPDTDGVPLVPARYYAPEGRKVVSEERGLGIHMRNLNLFSGSLYGAALLLLLAIAFIVYRVLTRKRRRFNKYKRK